MEVIEVYVLALPFQELDIALMSPGVKSAVDMCMLDNGQ